MIFSSILAIFIEERKIFSISNRYESTFLAVENNLSYVLSNEKCFLILSKTGNVRRIRHEPIQEYNNLLFKALIQIEFIQIPKYHHPV